MQLAGATAFREHTTPHHHRCLSSQIPDRSTPFGMPGSIYFVFCRAKHEAPNKSWPSQCCCAVRAMCLFLNINQFLFSTLLLLLIIVYFLLKSTQNTNRRAVVSVCRENRKKKSSTVCTRQWRYACWYGVPCFLVSVVSSNSIK